MRRIGDLMKDLGFNADSPVETQKSFIRHLIRVAGGAVPDKTVLPMPHVQKAESAEPKQLTFDPEVLGVTEKPKKAGGG